MKAKKRKRKTNKKSDKEQKDKKKREGYNTFQTFKSEKKEMERALLVWRVGTNRPPDREIWAKREVKNGENLRENGKNGGKMKFWKREKPEPV